MTMALEGSFIELLIHVILEHRTSAYWVKILLLLYFSTITGLNIPAIEPDNNWKMPSIVSLCVQNDL